MRTCVIDVETWWSTEHSLSKMNPMVYCTHPETEIISLAIKFDDYPTDVIFGEGKIKAALSKIDFTNTLVIGHNLSGFDSMILAWRLGVKPKLWGCTLAMARPIHEITVGKSLAKLVEHYGIGVKDNSALLNTKGRHLADFTPEEVDAMRTYNKADAEQCYALFQKLKPHYTAKELWHIDASIRQLVEPVFELDVNLLRDTLRAERSQKSAIVLDLAEKLGINVEGDIGAVEEVVTAQLASAPKFTLLLNKLGVEVPTKPSPTNPNQRIPAIAKSDSSFLKLLEHPDDAVANAARARLAIKSTLLETRITAFAEASKAAGGKLPIPINYCGATTTGRDSGWSYNPQNLPRVLQGVPKLTDSLRNSMKAPAGHKVVVADLSGIELRVNMFLWKVPYAMELFAADPEKADLYKTLASEVLGVAIEDIVKMQRQAGKAMHLGCFTEDTNVLTSNGCKRIVDVKGTDLVWDGESWVRHSGLIYQGKKSVASFKGVSATLDHEILTERGWAAWGEVCTNNRLYQSALSLATSPSSNGNYGATQSGASATTQSSSATAVGLDLLTSTTYSKGQQRGAIHALNKPPASGSNGIGSMQTSFQMTRIGLACSIACRLLLVGATATQKALQITVTEASQLIRHGVKIALSSFGTSSPSMVGINQNSKWTAPITIKGTPPATYGSSTGPETQRTAEQSKASNGASLNSNAKTPVYDLLNCGPNNRFTVLTDDGPIIVHNCGFGLGSPEKYVAVAKTMAQIVVSLEDAVLHIAGYRQKHPEIVEGWKECGRSIADIANGIERAIDPWGLCWTCKEGIRLPSGRLIRYPDLRQEYDGTWPDGRPKQTWKYGSGRNTAYLTGPKVDENIVQALARDVLKDYKVQVFQLTGRRSALDVHDELVYVVPEQSAQEHLDIVQSIMRQPPKWWPELVTWSEGSYDDTYGAAK